MAHRKWIETKQLPGTAGPGSMLGCCLISFHFRCDIRPIRPVVYVHLPAAKTSPPVAAVAPVLPTMAVPAAAPVSKKRASAKGASVITAREQMRTRLGRPIVVVVVMMRSGGQFESLS